MNSWITPFSSYYHHHEKSVANAKPKPISNRGSDSDHRHSSLRYPQLQVLRHLRRLPPRKNSRIYQSAHHDGRSLLLRLHVFQKDPLRILSPRPNRLSLVVSPAFLCQKMLRIRLSLGLLWLLSGRCCLSSTLDRGSRIERLEITFAIGVSAGVVDYSGV